MSKLLFTILFIFGPSSFAIDFNKVVNPDDVNINGNNGPAALTVAEDCKNGHCRPFAARTGLFDKPKPIDGSLDPRTIEALSNSDDKPSAAGDAVE